MKRIDAHQHFWDLNLPFDTEWLKAPSHQKIRRTFLPADLKPHLDQCGISQAVFVQAQHHLDETRWALNLADHYNFIAGVVGWVDLASPECEAQLLEFKGHPKFVGVRHITQAESDDNFIVRPEIITGLKVLQKHGVPFDLLFFVKHLKHAATLAKELPELPMVIDHLSKPKIKEQSIDDWLPDLKAAAKFPNLYVKLSGMVTEADWENWQPTDLRPYVQHAIDLFGAERCMFGSDWPVCELAGSYEAVFAAFDECISQLSLSEQEQIYSRTAVKFYNLKQN
ncbi:amidohydrolase family protein [Planctomicrobium sp. SH668]|uniref:amidohydrolase family protein n=1 Tax=Planctomicrobium sp. SH668 TaxID=3448126 RepID=UPI003F5CA9DD